MWTCNHVTLLSLCMCLWDKCCIIKERMSISMVTVLSDMIPKIISMFRVLKTYGLKYDKVFLQVLLSPSSSG